MTLRWLTVALSALAITYALWFGWQRDAVAALVFALPPLLLAWRSHRSSGRYLLFWTGMISLLWFSHGVMVAWSRPPERLPALAVTALSLWVVWQACLPGVRARQARRHPD